MSPEYAPAAVDAEQLKEIKQLEQQLGKVIVAVEPAPEYASLTSEELAAIREAEKKLGLVMVAYNH